MGNTKWAVAYMSLEHRGEARAGDRNMLLGVAQSFEITRDPIGSKCCSKQLSKKWAQGRGRLRDLDTDGRSTRKTEKEPHVHRRMPCLTSLIKRCLQEGVINMVRWHWPLEKMDSDVRSCHLGALWKWILWSWEDKSMMWLMSKENWRSENEYRQHMSLNIGEKGHWALSRIESKVRRLFSFFFFLT